MYSEVSAVLARRPDWRRDFGRPLNVDLMLAANHGKSVPYDRLAGCVVNYLPTSTAICHKDSLVIALRRAATAAATAAAVAAAAGRMAGWRAADAAEAEDCDGMELEEEEEESKGGLLSLFRKAGVALDAWRKQSVGAASSQPQALEPAEAKAGSGVAAAQEQAMAVVVVKEEEPTVAPPTVARGSRAVRKTARRGFEGALGFGAGMGAQEEGEEDMQRRILQLQMQHQMLATATVAADMGTGHAKVRRRWV